MTATFYKYYGDSKKISKQLTDGIDSDITLKNPKTLKDVNNIQIIMTSSFNQYNYVHISEFKRYYFIDRIENETNNYCILTLRTDVLKTYETTILNSKAHITKSENADSKNIDRDMIDNESLIVYNFKNFHSDDGSNILFTFNS